jgi:hypothetical protein
VINYQLINYKIPLAVCLTLNLFFCFGFQSKGQKSYNIIIYGDLLVPWGNNTNIPNRKTDTNNLHGYSTDFIGQNWDYPEASYGEWEIIIDHHRSYQQGLMWRLTWTVCGNSGLYSHKY